MSRIKLSLSRSRDFFSQDPHPYRLLQQIVATTDARAIALILGGTLYLAIAHPTLIYLFLAACLLVSLVKFSMSFIPGLDLRIKPWHLLTLSLTVATVAAFEMPASAQFFDSLEEGVKEVVSSADTGIDESLIETIFVFFRIIVVLAFLVGVVVVLYQAFRGNDWSVIANMLGVGVAFVIVVELISNLMIGNGSSGGG